MKIFTKRLEILGLCIALVLGTTCYQASAHVLWLQVRDYTPQVDEEITLTLGYGHYLPAREFMPGEDLEKIYILAPQGKKIEIKRYSDVEYKGDKPLNQEGTYLVVAKKKGGFFTKTTEGYKRGYSKKGLKNVIKCTYSEKYTKAIVNVGKAGGKNFSKVLGHDLEIIPLSDPGNLAEGDYLPVKIAFRRKVLACQPVYATYLGFSTEKAAFAYTTKTTAEGIAKIRIIKSGIWLITTEYKESYPDSEKCDQYSLSATLTFEVK
ncbi:DUF4198 domain-containing protein [bacterium]|nr:DUF4198 domain-containing protein [bacterium]